MCIYIYVTFSLWMHLGIHRAKYYLSKSWFRYQAHPAGHLLFFGYEILRF